MPDTKLLLREARDRVAPPSDVLPSLERRRDRKRRNQRVAAGVLGIAMFAIAAIAFVRLLGSEGTPAGESHSPFEGTWISTSDTDGGMQTMTVHVSADGAVEIVVRDDVASVCSGTPSTMTGTGRIEAGTRLLIPAPVNTCDYGGEPETLSGPPLTFVHDAETEILTDNSGRIWERDPSPDPTLSGGMWPQTSLEEVRQAQELADDGDPRYAWQVDRVLRSRDPSRAEIFARFAEEELGWEESLAMTISDMGDVAVIRCAPGGTNPLYPNDPVAGGCAPTIDGLRYETVQIAVEQLVRQGATGIWVVTHWEMVEPFEQVLPPSEADTTALLERFLQARIEGEGAEGYVDALGVNYDEIPFLYATPTGGQYERSEFEVVEGPLWPDGRMRFKVRLFAESGETVVEQFFSLEHLELGLGYEAETGGPGPHTDAPGTTVNGQVVPVPYSFLGGEVTLDLAYPWDGSEEDSRVSLGTDEFEGTLLMVGGDLPVRTGCLDPAPADAGALAQSIRSDADLDATPPVAVSVGGLPALRMDVTSAPGPSTCRQWDVPLPDSPRIQMRLYLVDLPRGSSAPILAIAITALKPDFDRAVESVAPIVDSIEIHPR